MNVIANSPDLLGVGNDLREVVDVATDGQQLRGRDDALKLRNQHALDSGIIPNSDIPASRVFLNCVRDVVGRYVAQHFRREWIHSHFRLAPAVARSPHARRVFATFRAPGQKSKCSVLHRCFYRLTGQIDSISAVPDLEHAAAQPSRQTAHNARYAA